MNHEQALNHLSAAAYLLGDLTSEECDEFEQHFFNCRSCADDIRAGVLMFAAGRRLLDELFNDLETT